ncbi:MAG TPA: hypothetical protein VFD34_07080, partial [Clostridia bacterium]|nr:hypothetical protein [Clostridia bacterium]
MKINKAGASGYNTVDNKNLVRYISEYTAHIYGIVYSKNGELEGKNRTELKAIAAELETVKKRLEWLVNGRY